MAEAIDSGPLTLTWSGRGVDPARIEAELVRLRYGAAGYSGAAEGAAIRTSLLNLVVYAANEAVADEASETLARLTGHHPSRALIIIADSSQTESRIDTRLAAHCHLSSGLEQQVCCEEVVLSVHGNAAEHLHSVIIPLLVPDLPVYVWWTGPLPRGRHIFEELIETSDRFIIDSARFRHPTHGLSRVANLCRETPDCAIGDLNWARLRVWRELLAQRSAAQSGFSKAIDHVEIGYTPRADDDFLPAQAFLLLGWMAGHFAWTTDRLDRTAGGEITLSGRDRSIAVRFQATGHPSAEASSLTNVRLQAGGASLTIRLSDDGRHLLLTEQTLERSTQETISIEPPGQGELLAAQLDDLPGEDTGYDATLLAATPVLEALDVAH